MTQSTRPALPPLPEPAFLYDPRGGDAYSVEQVKTWRRVDNAGHEYSAGLFTADKLRDDRRQIVELCAQIAETLTAKSRQLASWSNSEPVKPCELAAALRSLLDGEPK